MLARTETRTPQQLADGVEKSAALQRAESQRTELRAKRDAIKIEMGKVRESNPHGNINAQMNVLVAQELEIERQIADVRKSIEPLRDAHGVAVSKALALIRQAAAERVVELIDELRPLALMLQHCQALVERAGHQTVRVPSFPLDEIGAIARRLATK